MSAGVVVAIVCSVAVVVAVVWFLTVRRHPENAATHGEMDRHGSALHHGDVNDRPASPGAEADGVAGRWEPVPGPSAESTDNAP